MCESKEYRIPRLQEAYLDDEGRGAAYSNRQMNGIFETEKDKTARAEEGGE